MLALKEAGILIALIAFLAVVWVYTRMSAGDWPWTF